MRTQEMYDNLVKQIIELPAEDILGIVDPTAFAVDYIKYMQETAYHTDDLRLAFKETPIPMTPENLFVVVQMNSVDLSDDMIIDLSEGLLDRLMRVSIALGDPSLWNNIQHLRRVSKNMNVKTTVTTDYDAMSLTFYRLDENGNFRGNGGIIYHYGHGWSIHT